jgi:hypothetical protein
LRCDDIVAGAPQVRRAFVATYNAAQIASAPVLAIAANSPLFLGRRLWDEPGSRFRQAVDRRDGAEDDWGRA